MYKLTIDKAIDTISHTKSARAACIESINILTSACDTLQKGNVIERYLCEQLYSCQPAALRTWKNDPEFTYLVKKELFQLSEFNMFFILKPQTLLNDIQSTTDNFKLHLNRPLPFTEDEIELIRNTNVLTIEDISDYNQIVEFLYADQPIEKDLLLRNGKLTYEQYIKVIDKLFPPKQMPPSHSFCPQ